jgi:hypothetical protein
MNSSYSIGWDVGAWNTKTGDAVWILDNSAATLGKPMHGNIRSDIETAKTAEEFTFKLFKWCEASEPSRGASITLAIDAPLAFPVGFKKLLQGEAAEDPTGRVIENPYLFRRTDQFVAEKREPRRNPLSPLQDQIGSQATKVAHVLNKFGFQHDQRGVWLTTQRGAVEIRIIEAYPAMSKSSRNGSVRPGPIQSAFEREIKKCPGVSWDEKDALICALSAHLFTTDPENLHAPEPGFFIPEEGWIWFPKNESLRCKASPMISSRP